MFTIGSFAIIFDKQDRMLLCHRRDIDLWNLPGGGMQSGELPNEAVIRETREETGLEVTVDRLVGVYVKVARDDLVFVFVCRVVGGQLSLTDEAEACEYFDVDSLPPNISPKSVERIREALNPANQPVYRHQAGPSSVELIQKMQIQKPDLGQG